MLQGCYESLPVRQGAPPVAERVEFVLNDEGRVALANRLGPQVLKVEGQVLSVNADGYDIGVIGVTEIGGGTATWNGERVSVRKVLVTGYSIRRLSRKRTTFLVGGVTIGMLAFIFGKSLLFGGGAVDGPGGDPGPPSAIRSR